MDTELITALGAIRHRLRWRGYNRGLHLSACCIARHRRRLGTDLHARPKPDLVAPVPFPSLWRPRPFSGTSAASPQAAGLASLVWSKHPDWTAAQVWTALRQAAHDLGPPGHDYETGYGLIHLP